MRSCCRRQGTISSHLWRNMMEDVRKRMCMCIHICIWMTGSLCCTVEIDRTLENNYIEKLKSFKKLKYTFKWYFKNHFFFVLSLLLPDLLFRAVFSFLSAASNVVFLSMGPLLLLFFLFSSSSHSLLFSFLTTSSLNPYLSLLSSHSLELVLFSSLLKSSQCPYFYVIFKN